MTVPRRPNRHILTINAGSSSLKFAVFRASEPPDRLADGAIERIGLSGEVSNHAEALSVVTGRVDFDELAAVGHRVVHGGPRYRAPAPVTPALLDELRRLSPIDPEHLPAEIALIDAIAARHPRTPQFACFDTAFHHAMPRVATLVPLPRRYEADGVRRYGFHGLSYAFLMKDLERRFGRAAARGRVILAHLGNGASLAAVADGSPVDTTMAFTPAAGLVMSTRAGDLDPGLGDWFARVHGMTPAQFHEMVNKRSGLLGVSETSGDVRDLLAREAGDVRAAEALALFCYQVTKWIGAFAAALGGVDTLVFSGGIGERAPVIRARICERLGFLGIALDAARNDAGDTIVSGAGRRVRVCVLHTDEESEIASAVSAALRTKKD